MLPQVSSQLPSRVPEPEEEEEGEEEEEDGVGVVREEPLGVVAGPPGVVVSPNQPQL